MAVTDLNIFTYFRDTIYIHTYTYANAWCPTTNLCRVLFPVEEKNICDNKKRNDIANAKHVEKQQHTSLFSPVKLKRNLQFFF